MFNKKAHMVTFILVIIGGINWLLIGLFDWGIEIAIGEDISKIIYILIGLAAIYEIAIHKQSCKCCSSKEGTSPSESEAPAE